MILLVLQWKAWREEVPSMVSSLAGSRRSRIALALCAPAVAATAITAETVNKVFLIFRTPQFVRCGCFGYALRIRTLGDTNCRTSPQLWRECDCTFGEKSPPILEGNPDSIDRLILDRRLEQEKGGGIWVALAARLE